MRRRRPEPPAPRSAGRPPRGRPGSRGLGVRDLLVGAVVVAAVATPWHGSRPVEAADAPAAPAVPAPPDEVAAYFTSPKGPVPTLRLTISAADCATLDAAPKTWVRATLREGERVVYEDVGVHLKGSAGSFRPLSDKPGLTVRMDKFVKSQRFHGLAKFHLNNGVQDPTYLNEFVAAEVFQAAGIPAPRAMHARVHLNGRDLGAYVLKEGYDKRFLRDRFPSPDGNLYDGGFCTDIDTDLEKDEGKDPDDRADLAALLAACQETDPVKARAGIAAHLDVDAFLRFMALERMLGHWDGYCMNRNNYRIFVPASGRAVFLPHGADQLLGDVKAPILDEPIGIVAVAVLRDAAWQAEYRRQIQAVLPLFTKPERLFKRLDEASRRAGPALAGADGGPQPGQIKSRFAARAKNLVAQAALPSPKPLDLDVGEAHRVQAWRPVVEAGGAKLTQTVFGADRVLRLEAGSQGDTTASWRGRVLLAPGTYRFEAGVQANGVVATQGPVAGGLGVRVAGATEAPRLAGTTGWKTQRVTFTVAETRNVELSVELLASAGVGVAKLNALRVVRER
ncbi:MAG: CotH kinase family protein [Planctomycetia bacterium]|nr:CotH kinase family protein [Planctomycetia bacterium]